MKQAHGGLMSRLVFYRWTQRGLFALLLSVTGAVYLGFIEPQARMLNAAGARNAAAELQHQHDQERARNLPAIESMIGTLHKQLEECDKQIPPQPGFARFIGEMSRIGKTSAVQHLSWHLQSQRRSLEHLNSLPIQLSFDGDFQSQILPFLQAAEQLPRLIRIQKLDLRSCNRGSGNVTADITMNIYYAE